nr:tetratricopeptide repeat protein [Nostoc sp. DedQUE02]
MNNLGQITAKRGDKNKALERYEQTLDLIRFYEQSLTLNEQIGYVQSTARTLNNFGFLKANRGEIEEALAFFKQSFALNEQIGDVYGQALSLSNLGAMAEEQG